LFCSLFQTLFDYQTNEKIFSIEIMKLFADLKSVKKLTLK